MGHVADLVNLRVCHGQHGLDSSVFGSPKAGSCEHTYKSEGSTKRTEELAGEKMNSD